MTGCPIGTGFHTYALFLGGNFEGTRLNQMILERVKEEEIVNTLVPVFEAFCSNRIARERFKNKGEEHVRQGK